MDVRTLALNLEFASTAIADGVRLHEWTPGCTLNPTPTGNSTGTYLVDSYMIALELIPVAGESRTICTLELTGDPSVEMLKLLLADKSAELIAFKG
jgi:hypothetical protein